MPHGAASRVLASRIVASEDRLAEAAAEVVVLPSGRVIRQPDFPHVFDANLVRHPRLDEHDLDGALRRLCAPLSQSGVRHLQIACDAEPLPEGVKAGLRARGFLCDRLLAMTLPGRLARRADETVEVRRVPSEASFDEYADTMERMSREEPWYSPQVAREIVGSLRAKASAGAVALHVARLDGRPVGTAGLGLVTDGRGGRGGVGTITTVGTVPEARHRGVAQSLVVTLAERARAAGCDLVYLVARADDTPKEMYRKFGFEVAFTFEVWLRPPR